MTLLYKWPLTLSGVECKSVPCSPVQRSLGTSSVCPPVSGSAAQAAGRGAGPGCGHRPAAALAAAARRRCSRKQSRVRAWRHWPAAACALPGAGPAVTYWPLPPPSLASAQLVTSARPGHTCSTHHAVTWTTAQLRNSTQLHNLTTRSIMNLSVDSSIVDPQQQQQPHNRQNLNLLLLHQMYQPLVSGEFIKYFYTCTILWWHAEYFLKTINIFIGQIISLVWASDGLAVMWPGCGYLIIVKTNNGLIKHKWLITLTSAMISSRGPRQQFVLIWLIHSCSSAPHNDSIHS